MEFVDAKPGMSIAESVAGELERGVGIILDLDGRQFARQTSEVSSIGAHIRHNLDFVNALLNGVAERRVDYNARVRDPEVEQDRAYAIEQLEFACNRLRSLSPEHLSRLIVVRSEVDEDVWHASSISRELEFVHSHTVHHYALIARLIADFGGEIDSSVGVAPSTLRYRASTLAPA